MKKKIALVTMAKEEDLYLQEWIDYNCAFHRIDDKRNIKV